jgi:hypothetical protein
MSGPANTLILQELVRRDLLARPAMVDAQPSQRDVLKLSEGLQPKGLMDAFRDPVAFIPSGPSRCLRVLRTGPQRGFRFSRFCSISTSEF